MANVFHIAAQTTDSLQDSNSDLKLHIEQVLDSSDYYYDKGNITKSLQSNIKLLKLAQKLNDPKYLNQAYRFLGYDFLIIQDTSLARQNFESAKKFAIKLEDDVALGLSYMDLANYYSSAELNYEKALLYHKLSIKNIKKANDSTELFKAIFNATISAFEADKLEDGKQFLTTLNSEGFNKYNHESFLFQSHNLWAEYYNKTKEYFTAEMESRKAIDLLKYTDNIFEKAEAYKQLSISLAAQNIFDAAYAERLLYEKFNNEGMALQQNAQNGAAIAKFQVEKYQIEIEDQKEKTELQYVIADNKNRINNILLLVCLIGFLVIIALFVAYYKRRELFKALTQKNKEYLAAKERSEQLSKSKSKFFSTVSHELRTPLYGVIGLSTILLEDPSLKSHKKDLKSLKFSADYLLALINDVLQINKIEENTIANEKSSFHVRDFMQSIISTFEYMKIQNKNEIILTIAPNIPNYLYGNTTRLSQILMNLIGNACKFTENGSISVLLTSIACDTPNNQCVQFTVADNGIGIATDKQATVFDEFTQIESLDYTNQGTGLGLPIVKKLLIASGSDIKLESDIGKGTAISFDLTFEMLEKSEIDLKPTVVNENSLKGKRILVAEDNRINQIVTKKILEKKGVKCIVVENGELAVAKIKNTYFDLILMDLNMPVMDGFTATLEIRKFNTEIPIVALTAVEAVEVRNEISVVGMNDIIVKPYDDANFSRIIIENLRTSKQINLAKMRAV